MLVLTGQSVGVHFLSVAAASQSIIEAASRRMMHHSCVVQMVSSPRLLPGFRF